MKLFALREPNGESAGGSTVVPHADPPKETPPPAAPAAATEAEIEARVLAKLGVKNPEQVKAALEAQAKAEEAARTDSERAAQAKLEAERANAKASQLEAALRLHADAELAKLTPEQRDAVKALAGDDPAKATHAILKLQPTWAARETQKIVEAAPKAPAGSTAPASASNPKPGEVTPKVDHAAKLASFGDNFFARAAYERQHAAEIYPDS